MVCGVCGLRLALPIVVALVLVVVLLSVVVGLNVTAKTKEKPRPDRKLADGTKAFSRGTSSSGSGSIHSHCPTARY